MTQLDRKAQDLWDDYTHYKQKMFETSNTKTAPWLIVNADKKSSARLRAIAHILHTIPMNEIYGCANPADFLDSYNN
tara:strand:- start:45 stop:275 length:231 start_codon:yes stop_codon:yes gene_type:complete